jgi:hypothetical protein
LHFAPQLRNSYHATGKRNVGIDDDQSDEDESEESIGVHLNQQLIAAADARERGEAATFNQQWEQWMKEALERNEMDLDTILDTIRQGRPFPPSLQEEESSSSAQLRPARTPEIPTESSDQTPTRSNSTLASEPNQSYDELHHMLGELNASNARIAADNMRLNAQSAEIVNSSPRQSAEHARLSNLVEELQSNATRLEAENTAMQNYLSRTRTETAR